MFACLNPGMIGIETSPAGAIDLAVRFGFEGVELNVTQVADSVAMRDLLQRHRLKTGCCSGLLPIRTSDPDAQWNAAIAALPAMAARAADLGFTRTMAVVLPFHEELPSDANFALQCRRLQEAAPILANYGIRLGLEYVSQKTRRAPYRHQFLYTLTGLLELIEAAGQPNVGVLLDAFHWFCAGETVEAVRQLSRQQVVAVHLNDSVKDRPMDQQVAFERELPFATGVIDLPGFLNALRQIGYDGPLTAEPMNKALNSLPPDVAVAATAQAMKLANVP